MESFFRRISAIALAFAFTLPLLVGAIPANSAQTMALSTLEKRVDSSYALAAAGKHIDAASLYRHQQESAAGLDYFFNGTVGPRSDVVTNRINNQAFRFQQTAGLQLPIFGSWSTQQDAINEAQHEDEVAHIALLDTRRVLLGKLREAYTLYWQYARAATIDEWFLQRQQHDLTPAHSLVKAGFWTGGQLMGFLDVMQKTRADLSSLQSSSRAQLAAMRAIAGSNLAPFDPTEPTLDRGCTGSLDTATASAIKADTVIAQIDSQIEQYQADMKTVKHSAVEGTAQAGVGTTLDLPRGAGYSLGVGTTLSMPVHGRSEERAKAKVLEAEVAEQQLLREQREADLRAATELALEDLKAAHLAYEQSLVDQTSKREDLREAEVRFQTQHNTTQLNFNEVQTSLSEAFDADRTASDAQGDVWLKAAALQLVSPDACASP